MKQIIFYGIENKRHLDALDSFLQSQKHITYQGIINEASDSRASNEWSTFIYTGELEELEQQERCLYICVYNAPELAVAHDTSLQDWYQRHEQRLNWAMEHLETTILVEEYRTFQNLDALCALLSDQYDITLSFPQLPSLKVSISELTSQMGALALLHAEPKSQTLFEQLESAAELLGEDFNPSIAHRLATYQKKIREHERETKLAIDTEQANLAKMTSEFKEKTTQLETANLELRSENELALLQIHQLQEELEQAHLSATRTEQALKDELANVTFESDKTNAQLVTTNQELASENELALLQIHQLQEELEQTYLAAKQVLKLQSEIDQLQQSMDSKENMLNHNKQQLMDKLSEEQSKVELLNNKLAQQTTITTELQAENELALLQIHQLQEELEHYYLKYQQQARWTPIETCISNDSSHLQTTLQLLP